MIYWLCSSIPAKHLQYQCSTLITDRILDQAILSTAHCELETHFLSWTLKTALELGRVSNLPTVWTNTLAGLALSGSTATDWRLPVVLVSMTAAYTGGMFLNDAFDAAIDSEQRPERPIPSGTVSVASVFVAGFALLGVSVLLIAVCEKLHRLGGPCRRVLQAFAFGVFAEAVNDRAVVARQVV